MIHLDHNHSPSIPGPTNPQNLILSSSPRASQHRPVSWSTPNLDARPFYPDPQEQSLTDSSKLPSSLSDNSSAVPSTSPSAHSVPPGTLATADAENPSLPEPSTNSPTDARSPPADTSSSLSPPPDAASPNHAMDPPDDPPGRPPKTNGTGDVGKHTDQQQTADEVDRASRQSTPLSELSSAPETAPDDETDNGGSADNGDTTKAKSGVSTSTKGGNPASQPQNLSLSNKALGNDSATASGEQNIPSLHGTMAPNMALGHLSGQSSLPDAASSSQTSVSSKAPSLDPKVISILELNSLLLRVSIEYQARGVPITEPRFHQYSSRLQSNLTWLAAAADDNHKLNQNMVSLPVMQCPPPVEFPEMERIRQIYRELPTIFANEIARRQAHGMNGNAKRERTEESNLDTMHKRRDTGETKANAPFATPGAGPSTPHPPSQPMHVPNPIANISAGPVPRIGSPAMPPPPVPPGAMGANEAQLANMRARQQQMRAAAMQQQAEGRQMSPPSGMSSGMGMGGMQNIAGPSSMPSISQLNSQQVALLQGMGPQAMQNFQLLQTPGHPFVQYLTQQIPGFPQLPLQEKLQKMQMAQQMLQARQQQQRNAQAQGAGSMGGFAQGSMQGGITPQHTGDGSPPRMSPVSQQSPMQPSFPQAPTGDPRSMMTPQQQQAFASMNPQQRQLFLMQQQMMRGGHAGGGGGGMNQQMMNQQQAMQERMRIEQQRMAQAQVQAQAQAQAGSPSNVMGSPMVDGPQFPALRSNPGMPGIARSTRTPSDSNPSPVAGQRMSMSGQSAEDQQRAMILQAQQQQQQRAGMTPQQMQASFSGGPMGNPAYAAQMQQMVQGMGGGGQGANAFRMGSPPGSAQSPAAGGQMYGGGGGMQGFPGGGGGGPFMASSPSASQHEGMTPVRQTSATPGPHQQMGANPAGDQGGLNELDFFNWGQ